MAADQIVKEAMERFTAETNLDSSHILNMSSGHRNLNLILYFSNLNL